VIARIPQAAPERARIAAALGELVAALPVPLQPLVHGVAGLEEEIDLLARDVEGGAVVVRVAGDGKDLAALADLAAQCAWLAPRIADWCRLAPGLGLVPERGARGLLVAPRFDPRTRLAAAALPGIALARVIALEWQGTTALALEVVPLERPLGGPPAVRPRPAPEEPAPEPARVADPALPAFRTGLRDEDLASPRRPAAPRGAPPPSPPAHHGTPASHHGSAPTTPRGPERPGRGRFSAQGDNF
jgi:hypothetical protein